MDLFNSHVDVYDEDTLKLRVELGVILLNSRISLSEFDVNAFEVYHLVAEKNVRAFDRKQVRLEH